MSLPACAKLLADYIAIPSVNPMGRQDIDPAILGESRYAEAVAQELRKLGADVALIGQGARQSVVAELVVDAAAETVMIASHLDTVPVDSMTIAPFDPVVSDDRMHGRGACDTKGGMAALVAALGQVLQRGKLRRNLLLVGEADEEMASGGVRDVIAHLQQRAGGKVDWALATEPTDMRLVTRHKGRVSAHLIAHGRACHSSQPDEGQSAIVNMARMVLGLDELHREKQAQPDARLGPATLSVGLVGGGQAPNIVAERAWATVDRRTLPGEDPQTVRAELLATAQRLGLAETLEVAECRLDKEPLATDDEESVVVTCRALLRAGQLDDTPTGVAFGTDAGPLSLAGIPSVVMGPGSIAQAHTADEFLALDQLMAMERFFVRLLG